MKEIGKITRNAACIVAIASITITQSCKKETIDTSIRFKEGISYGTLTDATGNTYKTVKIGTQEWMAENLRTTSLNDGTPIANITDANEWQTTKNAAVCTYNNSTDASEIAVRGRLYNWKAVSSTKLCPKGWHVPSSDDWSIVSKSASISGDKQSTMREEGNTHWKIDTEERTNASGFTAIPAGTRSNGKFRSLDTICALWSVSKYDSTTFHTEEILNKAIIEVFNSNINQSCYINSIILGDNDGGSVRCLKD